MENIKPLIEITRTKLKQASLLWADGFREACCLHRVIVLCHRSRQLLIRTGQCFLLNGFIFLGRYNDIAKHGFAAMGRSGPSVVESSKQNDALTSHSKVHAARPAGLGGIMIGIGEQVYSVLLLNFFFLEVYATGFIPYVGKALNFLLLSWMYAYYCFEYKWNFSELGLDKRLDFFETNWAFFAGFGSPCVLAIFFFSPLVSYGVMAILFPLFVLTATGTDAEQVISTQRRRWSCAGLGKLPDAGLVPLLIGISRTSSRQQDTITISGLCSPNLLTVVNI
ncbi:protein EI24 homolog isoform X4 [Durio zibethinus]|uniref:Protein EI24 homolog isoform X4 n=1 Tax=Durio zibethinus TaxID=66656 RepID=A0A6P6ADD2_DURZI|nr:protein EI24 homolog isoform X4 [Durio zibethinus]